MTSRLWGTPRRSNTKKICPLHLGLLLWSTLILTCDWVRGDLSSVDASDNFTTGHLAIVIMAQGRSGSTLLGQTFRQNQDVLYWFEPCRATGAGLFDSSHIFYEELVGEECSDLVTRLSMCQFTLEDSLRLALDEPALRRGSPPLERLIEAADSLSAKGIAAAHLMILDECKRSRAAVVKTIRADNGIIDSGDEDTNIKVVHLVRDPRAVTHSQAHTFNVAHKYRRYAPGPPQFSQHQDNEEQMNVVIGEGTQRATKIGDIVCSVYRKQIDASKDLGEDRYKLVRYEDIASNPDQTVEQLYQWTTLGQVPTRVALWVHENTRLPDCGHLERHSNGNGSEVASGDEQSSGQDEKKCKAQMSERAGWDKYGTKRHAEAMASLWRTQMPKAEADAVWKACEGTGVMESFNYAL